MTQTMPTETLLVRFSSKRAYRSVPAESVAMINALKGALVACDWTYTGEFATGTLYYPLGLPIVDGGTVSVKRIVGCGAAFATIGGTKFVLYDPGRETPAATSACLFVGCGTNSNTTMDNLCLAIDGNTPFNTTKNYGAGIITLTAKVSGPEYNFVFLAADGRWGLASTIQEGGYTFTTGPEPTSSYSVKVRAYTGFYSPIIKFDFIFATGTAQFILETGTPQPPDSATVLKDYNILANPYQFVFTNGEYRNSTLLACAPLDLSGVSYSVFVIGPRELPAHLYGTLLKVSCVNSEQSTNPRGYPKFLQFRLAGVDPLLSPNGKPVYTTAYISYSGNTTSEGGIIGIVPDCVVCSDIISAVDTKALSGVMIAGVRFMAIGQCTGAGGETRGTLLMAIPDPKSTGASTGTGNMFGAGVTRLSGDSFTSSMVGKVFTMNGQSGTIESVTDSDHLTLTQPIAIIAGGTWTVA